MRQLKRLAALAASLFIAAASHAAIITVSWNSPPFNPAGVSVGTVTYPGGSNNAGAGRFEGTVTALDGIAAEELYEDEFDLFAYCFDLAQTLSTGAVYTVVPGAPTVVLDFLGAVNAYFAGDVYAWLNPTSKQQAAAIQLGIWEALHDDDFVLTTGSVRFSNVSAAVSSVYNEIVAFRGAASSDLPAQFVMRLQSDRRQDVITGVRPVGNLVPEPGTLLLVGGAAVVAGLLRRRRH